MQTIQKVKDKIVVLEQLKSKVLTWKQSTKSIAFTNGVFDLLHLGHIDYLSKAFDTADYLIIGINDDNSVKKLIKGPARPIKDEYSRAVIIASLQFVDAVILFSEETPLTIIKEIQPNILIKGGDYNPLETDESSKKYIVGSKEVKQNNGNVIAIPFLENFSTTKIEQKIIDLNS